MPTKDAGFWVVLWLSVREHMMIGIMVAVLTYLRIVYDGKEQRMARRCLESVIAGMFSLIAGMGVEKAGLNPGWGYFIAGAISFYGVDQIRAWGRRYADSKIKG